MKEEALTNGGAVLAAAAASLCCIGPLVFVMLGLGAFGAATVFDTAQPYLLGVAVLLLAFGFYRAYFRPAAACAPDEACATKKVNRASRIALWIAALAVITFVLSPYYTGTLARRMNGTPSAPGSAGTAAVVEAGTRHATFRVTGMTCAGCEMTIKLALEKTPGVLSSGVSYDRGEAIVEYDRNLTTPENLRDAINQTGYQAEIKK